MKLTFRTPFNTICDTQIEWLSLDTAGGRIKVFPGHASLVDHISFSYLRYCLLYTSPSPRDA